MTEGIRRIERAIACVNDERAVLRTERDAFRELKESIRSSRPVATNRAATPATRTVVQSRESTAAFARAYRQTVMATDHYESQYGESLEENVAMEFGPEIATALRSNTELSPLLYRKIQIAIDLSREKRSRLLDVLDTERDFLRDAIEESRDLDRRLDAIPDCRADALTFDELETYWTRLNELEDRCERAARSRQWFIAERRLNALDVDDHVSFNDYLYATLDSSVPVLKTVAETIKRIEHRR